MLLSNFREEHRGLSLVSEAGFRHQLVFFTDCVGQNAAPLERGVKNYEAYARVIRASLSVHARHASISREKNESVLQSTNLYSI